MLNHNNIDQQYDSEDSFEENMQQTPQQPPHIQPAALDFDIEQIQSELVDANCTPQNNRRGANTVGYISDRNTTRIDQQINDTHKMSQDRRIDSDSQKLNNNNDISDIQNPHTIQRNIVHNILDTGSKVISQSQNLRKIAQKEVEGDENGYIAEYSPESMQLDADDLMIGGSDKKLQQLINQNTETLEYQTQLNLNLKLSRANMESTLSSNPNEQQISLFQMQAQASQALQQSRRQRLNTRKSSEDFEDMNDFNIDPQVSQRIQKYCNDGERQAEQEVYQQNIADMRMDESDHINMSQINDGQRFQNAQDRQRGDNLEDISQTNIGFNNLQIGSQNQQMTQSLGSCGAVGVIQKFNQENPLYPDQFINDDPRHQNGLLQSNMEDTMGIQQFRVQTLPKVQSQLQENESIDSPDQIQPHSRKLTGSLQKPPKNQYLSGLESQRSANRDSTGVLLRQSIQVQRSQPHIATSDTGDRESMKESQRGGSKLRQLLDNINHSNKKEKQIEASQHLNRDNSQQRLQYNVHQQKIRDLRQKELGLKNQSDSGSQKNHSQPEETKSNQGSSSTGMKEDIYLLQSRIRDLETKIKVGGEASLQASVSSSQLNQRKDLMKQKIQQMDLNDSLSKLENQKRQSRQVVVPPLDQQSEITINNIELEQQRKDQKAVSIKNQGSSHAQKGKSKQKLKKDCYWKKNTDNIGKFGQSSSSEFSSEREQGRDHQNGSFKDINFQSRHIISDIDADAEGNEDADEETNNVLSPQTYASTGLGNMITAPQESAPRALQKQNSGNNFTFQNKHRKSNFEEADAFESHSEKNLHSSQKKKYTKKVTAQIKARDKNFKPSFKSSQLNKKDLAKSAINADICPSRFDMLKRDNRNNFNQFQEFQQEREFDMQILDSQKDLSDQNSASNGGPQSKTKTEKIFIEDYGNLQNGGYIKVKSLESKKHRKRSRDSSSKSSKGSNYLGSPASKKKKMKKEDLCLKQQIAKQISKRNKSKNSQSSGEFQIVQTSGQGQINQPQRQEKQESDEDSDDSLQKELQKLKQFKNEIKAKMVQSQMKTAVAKTSNVSKVLGKQSDLAKSTQNLKKSQSMKKSGSGGGSRNFSNVAGTSIKQSQKTSVKKLPLVKPLKMDFLHKSTGVGGGASSNSTFQYLSQRQFTKNDKQSVTPISRRSTMQKSRSINHFRTVESTNPTKKSLGRNSRSVHSLNEKASSKSSKSKSLKKKSSTNKRSTSVSKKMTMSQMSTSKNHLHSKSKMSVGYKSQRSNFSFASKRSQKKSPQSQVYQVLQEKYTEELLIKKQASQIEQLKQKCKTQQNELLQERQKSNKLQDMVEKLIVKLKGYYSHQQKKKESGKGSNPSQDAKDTREVAEIQEKLLQSEMVRNQQKQLIYQMRKEMQRMQLGNGGEKDPMLDVSMVSSQNEFGSSIQNL